MKFLVVADFHYALKQWDWLKQAASDFDLVVFAGDLLDIVSIVDKEVQILVTLKYLRSIQPQAPLLVTTGNHDGNQQNAAGENVVTWLKQAREFGVVIDGATSHADHINSAVSGALTSIACEAGIPVIGGVVNCSSLEQATERCGTKAGNRGADAARTAIEMANLIKQFDD